MDLKFDPTKNFRDLTYEKILNALAPNTEKIPLEISKKKMANFD